MEINRHNYEAFLLDQLEGRLSAEQQQQLEKFLRLNPDCARELPEVEGSLMEAQPLPHPHRARLKKEFPDARTILTDQNFDMFSIARLEQDLTAEQIRAHQAMLELDEEKATQWIHWQRSILSPKKIAFPEKERLLKRRYATSRLIWMSIASAAAVLALVLVLIGREQDLPTQEASVPLLQETESMHGQELPAEDELVIAETDPDHEPQAELEDDPPRKILAEDPDPPSTSQDQVLAMASASSEDVLQIPGMEILPGVISAQQLNRTPVIGEVNADVIEPLNISPVPAHHSNLTLAQIYDQGLQGLAEEYVEDNDISLWTVANAGIKGINKIIGSDISLLASRDEEGDISGFRLKTKHFSITRPLGRED